MSLQTLPLIALNWAPPPEELIDGQVLSAQFSYEEVTSRTEKAAATLLNSARRKAEQLIRQAKKEQQALMVEWEAKEEEMKKSLLQHCEAEWLEKHIQWMVQAENWEHELVDRVADRIQRCVETVLGSWCEQQSLDAILITRLSKQAQLMAQEESLILYVNPCHAEKARTHFAGRLKVMADPSLAEDQGILTSVLLTVEISLSRHFEQLMAWVQGREKPQGGIDNAD